MASLTASVFLSNSFWKATQWNKVQHWQFLVSLDKHLSRFILLQGMGTPCKHSGERMKTWEWIILFLDPVEEHRNVQTQTNTHTPRKMSPTVGVLFSWAWSIGSYYISLHIFDVNTATECITWGLGSAWCLSLTLRLFILVLFIPALVCKEWNIVASMFLMTRGHRHSWRRRRWLNATAAMNINE